MPPPATGGGWLTVAETSGVPASQAGGVLAPLRRGLGRIAAGWRYLADPAERHALMQQARGELSRMMQSLQRPAMTGSLVTAPPPAPPPTDMAEPDAAAPFDPEAALARLRSALRQLPDKGEVIVPGNLQSLDRLLAEPPPSQDFEAADLLHDCFPRGTRHSGNRVLLAVARNLTRNFGRPGRLPMTSGKSWTMLNPAIFTDQLAAQLSEICDFILNWQAQEKNFLILEFAEVELIEYLFEHLHPRRHGALLIKVMDFKVLSTRRAGLLRRIPARVRRFVQHTTGADPAVPQAYAKDTAALLELMEKRVAFRPVVDAAAAARAEVDKIIERLVPQQQELGTQLLGALAPDDSLAASQPRLGPIMQALGPSAAPAPQNAVPPGLISAAPMPPPTPPQSVSVSAPPRPAGLPVPVVPQRKRFANIQKTEAVMRVLAGENREQVAAALGATPDLVERWLDSFLNGGAAALAPRSKAKTPRTKTSKARGKSAAPVDSASIDDLKAKLQALLQTVEVLSTQIQSRPAETRSSPPAALPAPEPAPEPEIEQEPTSQRSEEVLQLPATPPQGFPTEDLNPPPRLKRSRTPRRR
ncbi:hypothetical protein CCC_02750 [Paramagnetospirillum magnetotacticum MS-1]|uniref:Insertion element IS150 protein InsJ-like helix-turn-helix domain-containing protein n=1 Tax=Paramagnetospirillum magnetotacticum MS-1 TaxID=272627 RepID=A0A0C2V4F5_PARME|nr:hypothetical protein CCC_02750 [Paramagnetospirillum magnetotacticum MS-1]